MLPPLGLGAMLPVACRRCIHLIAELGLTSNQSAASRRDAPDSTASTTRSRNSKEHGFGIDPPSKIRINARQIQLSKPAGESRFNSAEIRSSDLFRRHDISGWAKALWVIALVVVPYIAVFAYLIFQGRGMTERNVQQAHEAREELRRVVGFSAADEIEKLDRLKKAGSISEAEFARLRAKLV